MLGNLRLGTVMAAAVGAGVLLLAGAMLPEASGAREAAVPAGPLLSSGETVMGERIVYPTGAPARITAAVMTLAPGAETGWHTHGMPVLGYVIEGALEVDYGAKGVRVYRAGEAVLEAIDLAHNGRNIGDKPMKILAVFMGAEGLVPSRPAAP